MIRKSVILPGLLLAAIGMLVLWNPAFNQAKDEKPVAKTTPAPVSKPDQPPSSPTFKVEPGPFKIEVVLKGVLEAEQMAEVSIKLEGGTTPLVVKKAVEQGAAVKKGDVLVDIDSEKLDQSLKDLKVERESAVLAIRQAEEEYPVLEKTLPLDMAAAERAHKQAEEDLNHYLKVGRAMAEENANQSLKSSAFYLESAREELKQLQKMYRDKDLTEETEEFILKRQRHAVAMAELSYKHAVVYHDQTLKVTIPRQEQTNRENAAKQALAWEKAKSSLPLALNQKRLALAKLKYDQVKAEEKLRNVQKDRDALTVRAPADGIVYYGKCLRGQWTTAATVAPRLQRGGTLTADEVFLTVVSPGSLFVRATVEEKDLHLLQPGLKGLVIPTGFPDIKLPARLARLVPIPQGAGSFEARVNLEKEAGDRLVPGLACTVKFLAYRKDKALTVPASAVFEEDAEGETPHVFLVTPGAKPEKRPVKVGKTADGKTEILEGLREGEVILTSKPDYKALAVSPTKPTSPEE